MMGKETEKKDVLKKAETEHENSTPEKLDVDELEMISGAGLYEDYPEYYDASEPSSHSKIKRGLLGMASWNGGSKK